MVTLAVAGLIFYLTLPAPQPPVQRFYSFMILLCVVYVVSALITSGFRGRRRLSHPRSRSGSISASIKQCLPVGVLPCGPVAAAMVARCSPCPSSGRSLPGSATVEDGEFAQDIGQISFNEIPTLDRNSADFLGDRQMGTLSDMVSQFEYSYDSTQINYQGRPVRVAPHRLCRSGQVVHQPAAACLPM